MKANKIPGSLTILWGMALILGGCESGDDLSEPLPGPGPTEEWKFDISGMAVLGEDNTFIFDSWEDNLLVQTEYYAVNQDTVYLKGTQDPGSAIILRDAIFSPLYPTLNTEWWGPASHTFTVVDSGDVTVPAGTFLSFVYERTDSLSGEHEGTMVMGEDIGILAIEWFDEGVLQLRIVLDDYTITGGEGVFPLDMGNQWTLVEGEYSLGE